MSEMMPHGATSPKVGFVVHVADQCSTLDAHRPRLRVDVNGIHPGEVDEQAAIDTRESRDE